MNAIFSAILEEAKSDPVKDLVLKFLASYGGVVAGVAFLVAEQMSVVQQSIENEVSTVAVNASVAAREQFQQTLGSILGTVKSVLPVVLGLIRK